MDQQNTSSRLDCPVDVAEDQLVGEFVNAVRVLKDGGETLLDFMVYSPSEQHAKLVTRLRVKPSFLLAIRDRLEESVLVLDS